MKRIFLVYFLILLLSSPVNALANTAAKNSTKVSDTSLFLTPSLGYAHLKQGSSNADYKLRSDYYLFNLDIDLVDPSLAYHRIKLGHSISDSTTQTYGAASENFGLSQMQASYNVGIKKLSAPGDFAFWTGIGWQATKVKDVVLSGSDKATRLHFAYIPFGTELAFHHAGNFYMLVGAEYRLVMGGWENYQGHDSGNPQQSNSTAYATWLGLDYLTGNRKVLAFRLGYDFWEVKPSAKDDLLGTTQKTFKLDVGIRF